MRRGLTIFAAALAAATLAAQGAEAGSRKVDRRLHAVSIGVGVASTAGYFALNDWNWKWDSASHGVTWLGAGVLTTVGCAALSPIVATAVLNRPLTQREAGILVGSCVIPIIGGWLVNEAYKAHPEWEADYQPAPVRKVRHARHVRRLRHKKM